MFYRFSTKLNFKLNDPGRFGPKSTSGWTQPPIFLLKARPNWIPALYQVRFGPLSSVRDSALSCTHDVFLIRQSAAGVTNKKFTFARDDGPATEKNC